MLTPQIDKREPGICRNDDGSYTLTTRMVVKRPVDVVFAFFSRAENLDAITPPWLNFRITTAVPIEIGEGTQIDYSLRLHRFPVRWRSRIEDWSPPFRFADVQLKGPYRNWRHEHRFMQISPAETAVEDEVTYRVPGGAVTHRLLVRRELLRIFSYRQEQTRRLLEDA
ncbi:MAG: SRPBCC family protein [Chloroflexi bacterium]|nr:SRPBCC family protein [Chloroflexota bacterium]